ncbi:MAG: dihydrolipoamide acetyltransferase family protein [Flavobacteriales bacterium]
MAEIVRMPKLSDTMTDGVVAVWHKKVGDTVKTGDLLAEIESDKATMEFESFQEGVLLHIGIEAGTKAPVDSILAILGKAGEDVKAIIEADKAAKPEAAAPAPTPSAAPVAAAPAPVASAAPAKSATPAPAKKAAPAPVESNGRMVISPLAKRLAEERNLPLGKIRGSGDGGRIVKRDIDNFLPGSSVAQIEGYSELAVSSMRGIIAKRLSESLFTAPHFYLTMDIDMDEAMRTRKAIIEETGDKVSFNDIVLKAVAAALPKHPAINSSWLGDRIRYNEHVHIGVAMAIEDGLIVPVVKFANTKSIQDISAEVKDFAARSKAKKLTPADWAGNTFTISNLGMYGIEEFTAIINPPDACILAVGGIRQVPVVKNGAVVPGNMMKVTLSCDHRVVDGATGAAFLQTLKKYIENPVLIFMQ